ncbi:MAG TPA: hypothetical protein VIM51_15430 [Desulfosporosinus sp.]
MENNYKELLISARDLLTDIYHYPEERVLVDYSVLLKDGSTFKADLVLTSDKLIPQGIVFATSGEIPVEQVKTILAQSSLQFGVVFQMKADAYAEFWGIEKKSNIFTGKLSFESIPDYPNPNKFANVNFVMAVIESIFTLMQGG